MKSSSNHEFLEVLPQEAVGLLAPAGQWQPDHLAVHCHGSVLLSLEDFDNIFAFLYRDSGWR